MGCLKLVGKSYPPSALPLIGARPNAGKDATIILPQTNYSSTSSCRRQRGRRSGFGTHGKWPRRTSAVLEALASIHDRNGVSGSLRGFGCWRTVRYKLLEGVSPTPPAGWPSGLGDWLVDYNWTRACPRNPACQPPAATPPTTSTPYADSWYVPLCEGHHPVYYPSSRRLQQPARRPLPACSKHPGTGQGLTTWTSSLKPSVIFLVKLQEINETLRVFWGLKDIGQTPGLQDKEGFE